MAFLAPLPLRHCSEQTDRSVCWPLPLDVSWPSIKQIQRLYHLALAKPVLLPGGKKEGKEEVFNATWAERTSAAKLATAAEQSQKSFLRAMQNLVRNSNC